MTLLNRKLVICALVVTLALSVAAERGLQQTDLSDLGSEISAQVSAEVERAQQEMARKCGPDANSISGDTCYGKCSGSLVIDNSECTCNGEPCVSWKVGETGPSTTSATPSTGSASDVVQASGVRAVSVVSALLACIVALLL
mmetsp:Transcript_7222/g.14453  ORF Transcript_7222/g.14453 Transcript_7222/m.14453 type:complete len:142 (+) Transcript_7222:159-584(+)|eukprot:CAMPEP_0118803576 /NCGR_PEP_ID=MMETSP1161-20130426/17952_1 /TAXON_ID=249345 /ORGANISM="Picochlorum oklahomensis, Strain CCMP2329" /LENGTH=141 /DNA_ID=CAMNT_0006732117 /DNA_START=151 /DNA_END=576 /DNA_ORIENTATION=-